MIITVYATKIIMHDVRFYQKRKGISTSRLVFFSGAGRDVHIPSIHLFHFRWWIAFLQHDGSDIELKLN